MTIAMLAEMPRVGFHAQLNFVTQLHYKSRLTSYMGVEGLMSQNFSRKDFQIQIFSPNMADWQHILHQNGAICTVICKYEIKFSNQTAINYLHTRESTDYLPRVEILSKYKKGLLKKEMSLISQVNSKFSFEENQFQYLTMSSIKWFFFVCISTYLLGDYFFIFMK